MRSLFVRFYGAAAIVHSRYYRVQDARKGVSCGSATQVGVVRGSCIGILLQPPQDQFRFRVPTALSSAPKTLNPNHSKGRSVYE